MMPTGSRLERSFACLASAVLPRLEISGEAAQMGIWKHVFFSKLRHGLDEALLSVPEEYRAACEAIDVSSFKELEAFDSEVPLVYDVKADTTRLLSKDRGHRDYGERGQYEIAMTLDVSGVGPAEVMAADLKTGHSYVPPAHRNWQLMAAALALEAVHRKGFARVALIHAPEGMTPRWDVATHDAFALADARLQLLSMAERIQRAKPETAPMALGEQCRYCPSKLHCPAHTALIQLVAAKPGETLGSLTNALTPEKAYEAYIKTGVLRQVVRDLEASLKTYAADHPIELGDGRTYGPKLGTETIVEASIVRDVLSKLHGTCVADMACEFEASKASIERALRGVFDGHKKAGQKVTLKALTEEAMSAIAEAGGLKTREVTRIKEA